MCKLNLTIKKVNNVKFIETITIKIKYELAVLR